MKFNEEFAVVIGNEEFRNSGIEKMSVSFEGLEMTVSAPHGSRCIKCALTEAEIYPIERADMRKGMAETVCRNTKGEEVAREKVPTFEGYYMCGDRGFYGPPMGSRADDIKIVSPPEKFKKALDEAMREFGNKKGDTEIKIDGESFAKLINRSD